MGPCYATATDDLDAAGAEIEGARDKVSAVAAGKAARLRSLGAQRLSSPLLRHARVGVMVSAWLNTQSCLMARRDLGVEVTVPGRFHICARLSCTELDARIWIAAQQADGQEAAAAT